jgi:hypothetical protein
MLKRLLALLLCLTLLAEPRRAGGGRGFLQARNGILRRRDAHIRQRTHYVFFLHSNAVQVVLTETTDFVNSRPIRCCRTSAERVT